MSDLHFYTTQKLSGRRSKTPEGFLLIEGVPLARTGVMIYGPDEVPVAPGPDGLVRIERSAEEVFRPETIASANGKDLVDNHPQDDVMPSNWDRLSLGVLLNPRRGVGIEDDFLIGDILVKSQKGIDLIENGKVELSMGYDSHYNQIEPGRGYQHNIIYNHVALVDKGRCGPRCSIGDRMYIQEKNEMAKTNDRSRSSTAFGRVRDRILKAFKNRDEELLEETLGDAEAELENGGTRDVIIHNHHSGDNEMTKEDDDKKTEDTIRRAVGDALRPVLDAIDERFEELEKKITDRRARDEEKEKEKSEDEEEEEKSKDEAILGELEMEAPPGTNDRARKARDSAYLADSFQETVALAEVIAPGIRVPTFDRAASPRKSFDTICNLRRTALEIGYNDAATRGIIDEVGAKNFKTMDCAALRPAFRAVAAMKKASNNKTHDSSSFRFAGGGVAGPRLSIAEINKRNAEYYSKK